MKYIITESKLEETIMNYFDKIFDIQDLHWTHPYEYFDDGTEGEDENRIIFYIGDYDGSGSDGCFRWYDCKYFNPNSPVSEECPMVSIESQYENQLNGYFGDMWHGPFKKWLMENFKLPVKTVD